MKSIVFAFIPLFAFGCGDGSSNNSSPDMAMPATTLGTPPTLAVPCTDQVADVYNLPAGLPAMDMTHRGDVFHCAVGESMTAKKVNDQISAYDQNYANAQPVNVTSGIWTYRVAYRTLRNTPQSGGAPAEGDTAAILAVPEKPLAGAPLVVFGHGSVGFTPACAPTRLDLSAPAVDEDYPVNIMRLASYGYTVIAPDYPGFSYGQPPGYFNAEDEAHAILDATRAAANLLPTMPDKVVFVGHSQGGHAVLSAQSYAKAYGMKGTLAGVAAMAPLWTSMSIWAAATTDAGGLTTANDAFTILYAMAYAYSAGVLRGDAGGGLAVFQPAKQQAAKDVILNADCYNPTAQLMALGAKPADFFDANYVSNVGFTCAATPIGSDCTQAPSTPAGDAPLWLSRWREDRPPLDDQSAPILVWYGGMDTTVKPGWAECAREKFTKDLSAGGAATTISYCYDADAGHRDILRRNSADYVNQWIAARAGIGSDPAPCTPFPSGMTCLTPPNDL